jgi:hypothetical protein
VTIASFTVLTPADVANQVSGEGLDVLGLTVPMLSMQWSASAPDPVDPSTLRMNVNTIVAPFTGTWEVHAAPTRFAGPDGIPYATSAGVLALHPEAVHRLESLVATRLGSLDRPVPVAMLVHGVSVPAGQVMQWFRAGEIVGASGEISFHDRRGLIIDPLAVAALFDDLLAFRNGLTDAPYSVATVTTPGGIRTIANTAPPNSVVVHAVDLHGAPYGPRRAGSELQVLDGATVVADVPASGLVDLAAGQSIGRLAPTPSATNQIVWGPSPGGTLDTIPFAPPSGVALRRQFFRVVACDLAWHVLGNRAFAPGAPDVPAEADYPPNAPLPVVRPVVANATLLVDGNDVLGAMGAALTAFPPAADRLALVASPQIDTSLAFPATSGAGGRWPATPGAPAPPADATVQLRAFDPSSTVPTATWRTPPAGDPRDVIVTLQAGALPAGTHVRIYPRTFQLIRAIGDDPSFVRGDGGAAIVPTTGATSVLLTNPFALASADPLPDPPTVTVDIVAVGQDSTRRLVSSVSIPVGAPQPFTDNTPSFGGAVSPIVLAAVNGEGFSSIAPVRIFGIDRIGPTPATPGAGASFTDWVRFLSNEGTWPRVGPHLPSQARFETILALGAQLAAGAPYRWSAVVTGARLAWDSRCASPELGDPGNPAGPDVHVTGIAVAGQLASDLAFHALKRCQSIVPTNATFTTGWMPFSAGDNWNDPPADPLPPAGRPFLAGAMLETISAVTDSPELALLDVPSDTDTIQSVIDGIVAAMGLPAGSVSFTLDNEPRLRRQLQREIATAKRGQRDTMWSLTRAIAEAREYVYIESATFQRTARTGDAALVDLVALLRARLDANPRVKVLICVPRFPDIALEEHAWVRAAFRDRTEAIEALTGGSSGPHRDRVAAFHPIGFPGRSAVGRSSVVLVDDVFATVGTSHWRRRGMTFDGGCDVALVDRRLDDRGVGATLTSFRQRLLATRLGVPVPSGAATTTALWTRLAEPESAFDAVADLLRAGGLGRCTPVYAGPDDTSVIPESVDKTDPNGLAGPSLTTLLGGIVP